MDFLNSKTCLLALLLISLSNANVDPEGEKGICPAPSNCDNCNTLWDHPGMTEEQVLIANDLCQVTFTWVWPFNSTFTGPNPRLVFQCIYEDNGDLCNIGNEDVCASCEVFTLNGVRPSRSPIIQYSDTCGYIATYEVARNCLPATEPPTTVPATTAAPTTDPATTAAPTTVPATTAAPTTDPATTAAPTTVPATTAAPTTVKETTAAPETTTDGSYYCPDISVCDVCPAEWQIPEIYEEDFAAASDFCDVTLFWDSKLGSEGGPKLGFSCIYAENGEYCDSNIDVVCASCENITIIGVQPSLRPFVHMTDSCNNTKDFNIAENCQFTETTTSDPVPYCPDPAVCQGCDASWGIPSLQLSGTPLANDTCDITVSWTYIYSQREAVPNPRLTFQCIYETNGEFCEDGSKSECASCEEVTFTNVNESMDPYINYSDTCGNLFRLNVGEVCN